MKWYEHDGRYSKVKLNNSSVTVTLMYCVNQISCVTWSEMTHCFRRCLRRIGREDGWSVGFRSLSSRLNHSPIGARNRLATAGDRCKHQKWWWWWWGGGGGGGHLSKITVTTDLAISLGMSTTSCSDGFKPSISKAWHRWYDGYSFKHRSGGILNLEPTLWRSCEEIVASLNPDSNDLELNISKRNYSKLPV